MSLHDLCATVARLLMLLLWHPCCCCCYTPAAATAVGLWAWTVRQLSTVPWEGSRTEWPQQCDGGRSPDVAGSSISGTMLRGLQVTSLHFLCCITYLTSCCEWFIIPPFLVTTKRPFNNDLHVDQCTGPEYALCLLEFLFSILINRNLAGGVSNAQLWTLLGPAHLCSLSDWGQPFRKSNSSSNCSNISMWQSFGAWLRSQCCNKGALISRERVLLGFTAFYWLDLFISP